MKKRKNKSTSFNLECEYDHALLQYAEKKEHGKFSEYIKRLIHMDREGKKSHPTQQATAQVHIVAEKEEDFTGFI